MDNLDRTNRFDDKRKIEIPTVAITIFIILVVFCLFCILTPYFFSIKNMLNILQYSSITGVVAVGMTFVLVGDGIDISVGSVITLVGMVISTIIPDSGHIFEMFLMAAAIGIVCGFINGFFITKMKIVPFAVTLGTMEIYKGIAFLMTKGVNTPFMNKEFLVIGRGSVFGGFPISFIIMLCMLLFGAFILAMTPFGKRYMRLARARQQAPWRESMLEM